jgi:hypothetical protein
MRAPWGPSRQGRNHAPVRRHRGTEEPTLHFTVDTTPHNSVGATISQDAARRLIRELTLGLGEIEHRKRRTRT